MSVPDRFLLLFDIAWQDGNISGPNGQLDIRGKIRGTFYTLKTLDIIPLNTIPFSPWVSFHISGLILVFRYYSHFFSEKLLMVSSDHTL